MTYNDDWALRPITYLRTRSCTVNMFCQNSVEIKYKLYDMRSMLAFTFTQLQSFFRRSFVSYLVGYLVGWLVGLLAS